MHIMIDIETLDTAETAAIIEIGAVTFAFDSDATNLFYIRCGVLCQSPERTVSPETVGWWRRQGFRPSLWEGTTLKFALLSFKEWILGFGEVEGFWARDPIFDIGILNHAFRQACMAPPWSYNQTRSCRTMEWLCPEAEVIEVGTKHNAADDAMTQVLYVKEAYKELKCPHQSQS